MSSQRYFIPPEICSHKNIKFIKHYDHLTGLVYRIEAKCEECNTKLIILRPQTVLFKVPPSMSAIAVENEEKLRKLIEKLSKKTKYCEESSIELLEKLINEAINENLKYLARMFDTFVEVSSNSLQKVMKITENVTVNVKIVLEFPKEILFQRILTSIMSLRNILEMLEKFK